MLSDVHRLAAQAPGTGDHSCNALWSGIRRGSCCRPATHLSECRVARHPAMRLNHRDRLARRSAAGRRTSIHPAPPMLTLSGILRVFLSVEPCDMRKSFDGLHTEVVTRLGDDPRSGAVFVFINRSRTLIKLLRCDGTGLWVHAKMLERGTYRWSKPADAKNGKLSLEPGRHPSKKSLTLPTCTTTSSPPLTTIA